MNWIKYTCIFYLFLLLACSADRVERNPYLIEPRFAVELNTSLPLYAPLKISGNSVYISTPNVGIKGVFVANFGNTFYAWEAACPNHELKSCSTMNLKNNIFAKCSCDDLTYSLANGAVIEGQQDGVRYFSLISYRTSVSGDIIRVFN